MDGYGEAYKRELERARVEAKAVRHGLKPTFDVNRTLEKFHHIVEELQTAGAPVSSKQLAQTAP
ncbi:MAG: hypothetical protein ACRDRT_03360, partial [Pseudonocardiaceae bacterium]